MSLKRVMVVIGMVAVFGILPAAAAERFDVSGSSCLAAQAVAPEPVCE